MVKPTGEHTNIKIRLAKPGDAAVIAVVVRDAYSEYSANYSPAGLAATNPNKERVLAQMSEGPIWVGQLNDEVVATVSVVPRDNDLYIRGMAVLPAARGHRLGATLLDTIEEYARANGFRRLTLSTATYFDRALRLYKSSGFVVRDDGPTELHGVPVFSMEKWIDRGLACPHRSP